MDPRVVDRAVGVIQYQSLYLSLGKEPVGGLVVRGYGEEVLRQRRLEGGNLPGNASTETGSDEGVEVIDTELPQHEQPEPRHIPDTEQ